MTRTRYDVLIAVGSNVESEQHVPRATALLVHRFTNVRLSATYEGTALDAEGNPAPDQPLFTNLAVRLSTDLPFAALREVCRLVEAACGRVRTDDRYAPRPLDLDVVFGDEAFLATTAGALPDPELITRAYVLVPAVDVWPDAIVPGSAHTLAVHLELMSETERGMLRETSG